MQESKGECFRLENAIYELGRLYEQYGYRKYKMSKFEEYGLYLENMSFLPSRRLLSFTGPDGRLMALKPDVTLSIAKNAPQNPSEPEKLYYTETVYRVPQGGLEFREIMQLGLECIGEIDLYTRFEVLSLACKSLALLSEDGLMVVSHMGFVSGLLEALGRSESFNERLLRLISHKNVHEATRLCREAGLSETQCETVTGLISLYGSLDDCLPLVEGLVRNEKMAAALEQLKKLAQLSAGEPGSQRLMLDFSVIHDLDYYNGLIFRGYIEGLPAAVISGGQYDRLMERLDKNSGAIGFALYADQLERFVCRDARYDVDILLLYDEKTDEQTLAAAVSDLTAKGERLRVQKHRPKKLRYRKLMRLGEGGLELLEECN